MNDVQKVYNFHGDNILLVEHDGEPYVAMKPVVGFLGLNWASQYVKINGQKEKYGCCDITTPSAGGPQSMTCIPLKNFAGWLYSVNSNKVTDPVVRAKVELYQAECNNALYRYWFEGSASRDTYKVNDIQLPDFNNPSEAARAWADKYDECRALHTENRVIQNEKRVLEIKEAVAKPKIEFHDAITASEADLTFEQAAKILNIGVGQNKLFEILRHERFIEKYSTLPYQSYIDSGMFRVVHGRHFEGTRTKVHTKTLICEKYLPRIREIVRRHKGIVADPEFDRL